MAVRHYVAKSMWTLLHDPCFLNPLSLNCGSDRLHSSGSSLSITCCCRDSDTRAPLRSASDVGDQVWLTGVGWVEVHPQHTGKSVSVRSCFYAYCHVETERVTPNCCHQAERTLTSKILSNAVELRFYITLKSSNHKKTDQKSAEEEELDRVKNMLIRKYYHWNRVEAPKVKANHCAEWSISLNDGIIGS